MSDYMIVAEHSKYGDWHGTPNAFSTEVEAVQWARTEPKPPYGYLWMVYRIDLKREVDELNVPVASPAP